MSLNVVRGCYFAANENLGIMEDSANRASLVDPLNVDISKNLKSLFGQDCAIRIYTEENELEEVVSIDKGHVHFFFAHKGNIEFKFSPFYSRGLQQGNYFLIYDQAKDLMPIITGTDNKILYLRLSPAFIHDMLLDDHQHLVQFKFDDFGVKEYSEHPIEVDADLIVENIIAQRYPTSLQMLYLKSKILELLSVCYDVPSESRYEACPFLKDQENIEKIKNAREILIENMANPPGLKDLSKLIGMNEYNLKLGFKNVYGLPAYKYLQEYKLNYSKELLKQTDLQVAEIADEIGYKSASHFIEAFRKKFSLTPKKYQTQSK